MTQISTNQHLHGIITSDLMFNLRTAMSEIKNKHEDLSIVENMK